MVRYIHKRWRRGKTVQGGCDKMKFWWLRLPCWVLKEDRLITAYDHNGSFSDKNTFFWFPKSGFILYANCYVLDGKGCHSGTSGTKTTVLSFRLVFFLVKWQKKKKRFMESYWSIPQQAVVILMSVFQDDYILLRGVGAECLYDV